VDDPARGYGPGMSAQGTIQLERSTAYTDKLRAYKVTVDGTEVGTIKQGTTESFPVAPGSHDVQLKLDWAYSPILTVDVPPGGTVRLQCRPRPNPFTVLWYSTVARKKYLRLEPAA
jgi:hypothetical protein